jgi:hypothetical protein
MERRQRGFFDPILGTALNGASLGADVIRATEASDSATVGAVLRGLWVDQIVSTSRSAGRQTSNTLAKTFLK